MKNTLAKFGSFTTLLAVTVVLAACESTTSLTSPYGPSGYSGFQPPVLNFVIPPKAIQVGSSAPLTVAETDSLGNTGQVIPTWASSDPTISAVTDSGQVYGISDGSVTITATSPDSVTATLFLNIIGTATFPSAANVNMTVDNNFSPTVTQIMAGGSVSFIFPAAQHSVVFKLTGNPAGTPGSIPPTTNATVGVTFTQRGLYQYACTIHPTMRGVVVVH